MQRRIDFLDHNLLDTTSTRPQSRRHKRFLLQEVAGIERIRAEALEEYGDLVALLIRIDTAFCTLYPQVCVHSIRSILVRLRHRL